MATHGENVCVPFSPPKDADEEKSLAAKDTKEAKEEKSFTAKDTKDAKESIITTKPICS
jgi:hypothetical protein